MNLVKKPGFQAIVLLAIVAACVLSILWPQLSQMPFAFLRHRGAGAVLEETCRPDLLARMQEKEREIKQIQEQRLRNQFELQYTFPVTDEYRAQVLEEIRRLETDERLAQLELEQIKRQLAGP